MIINSKEYKKLNNTRELEKAHSKLKKYFNKYIVLRDLQKNEVTGEIFGIDIGSGRKWLVTLFSDGSLMNGREFSAGHFWKSDRYASVRYDERNVNGQLSYLNVYAGGDEANYAIALRKKIGDAEFEQLKIDRNKTKIWNILELEVLSDEYREKAKLRAKFLGIKL